MTSAQTQKADAPMESSLVFVISPPRAGSTLLQRMLGAHSEVFTHPEPHLITPLAYLGYHDQVLAAPYDHINAAEAIRSFVDGLPNQEADYLDAVRAYTDVMYGRMLRTAPGKKLFLDKTPAYALVLPFLTKLYPKAKYIVLTRHPLAVFSSYAQSFFDGDWNAAHAFNPVLERYVPAMADVLRKRDTLPVLQVGYESLVAQPEQELQRIFPFLGLSFEASAVEYGNTKMKPGMGDPMTVNKHSRPVTDSLEKWASELAHDTAKRNLAERMLERIGDEDLRAWGFERDALWEPLRRAGGQAPKPATGNYANQRKAVLLFRKLIHAHPQGTEALRKARYVCDVLLRERLES